MKTPHLFIFILTVYFLGFFLHAGILGKTVYGDGIYYYAWLRSLVIDHDISFTNDYAIFGAGQQLTKTGLLGNIYPVGPGLLWLPSFLLTHRLINGNGISLPYQLTVGFVGVAAALIGLLILYRLLIRFFAKIPSLAATIAIALATNLAFYGSLDTVNSHALSFLFSTVFLSVLLTRPFRPFVLGVLLGIMSLIRPQDALFIIFVIARPFLRRSNLRDRHVHPLLAMTIKVAIGFLIAFLPQLLAWQTLYGTFLKNPYLDRGYGFAIFQPHILEVLFSLKSGLILWTPIVAVALAGLFLKNFPSKVNRWFCLLTIAAQIYLVSTWTTWWQGASFSGRMFISSLPIFALGLANVFQQLLQFRFRLKHILYLIIFPLATINAILILYFLLTT